MSYTVKQLANLAGISDRTLRYYHEIGLLILQTTNEAGYRLYGEKEVDTLQQILFYKELGLELEKIKEIITDSHFNRGKTLYDHLEALMKKQEQISQLIQNVTKTIHTLKGEENMTDQEKFEGFKANIIEENERQYGQEIRTKYGKEQIDAVNKKFMAITKSDYQTVTELEQAIKDQLKLAVQTRDSKGELAQEVCRLHKEWICYYWPEGTYTKEAHKGLAQMYVDDARFKSYYEKIVEGGAEFLRNAIFAYCEA